MSEAVAAPAAPAAAGNTGPLGHPRSAGRIILLNIVTFGIYGLVWIYRSFEEMKQHTGEGVGGWLGVVLAMAVGVVTPFLLPQEIRKMYERDGQQSPVSGKTGLWMLPGAFILIGPIIWVIKCQNALSAYWISKGATA